MALPRPLHAVRLPRAVWRLFLIVVSLVLEIPGTVRAILRV